MRIIFYLLRSFGCICFICLAMFSFAQTKKEGVTFNSLNSVGMLNGENASSFTLQSINGITYKQFFSGIGIAIDNYGYRTVPVFWDIRKTIGSGHMKPLLFSDFGIGYHLKTDQLPEKWANGITDYVIKNSFSGEWGVGIEKIVGTSAYFVTASYAMKKYAYTQNNYLGVGPQGTSLNRFDYTYNRIVLRMGVRL